jgi:hypothetical protein
MNKEQIIELVERAYRLGFGASGQGYNAEYPYSDKSKKPEHDKEWLDGRNLDLEEIYKIIGEIK